ncbi:MAG: hypothetical protein UX19_C0009G0008 [Candidatus Woesebacteria bacterium GW2011_GWA1_45_8]|uniref:tRNA threonylcarbamoyladenosine biosynthesis protein TsaE n=1 Tax=Candidatus Woesebacteria bacterium GW2011_GWA1_45_8 TaxID=1618559 RepID=A0A0G1Q2X5_9BACT|nr:MAG: hypothetical protein UX19_C0009G0008 [Candidatus Woesebacteria bacterium GW2011_GWA1_45_8]
MEFTTKSPSQTQKLGQKISADITSGRISPVIALSGDLGSGKTTFVQGLAKGLGVTGRIISPTFILMRKYDLPSEEDKNSERTLYHVDLYRLEGALDKEILNLGLPYIWSDPSNIVLIEWAEKIKSLIPSGASWITFENMGEALRKITLK